MSKDKDNINNDENPLIPIQHRNPDNGVVVNFAYRQKNGPKLPLTNLNFDIPSFGCSTAQFKFDDLDHANAYIKLAQKQYPKRKLIILTLT